MLKIFYLGKTKAIKSNICVFILQRGVEVCPEHREIFEKKFLKFY